MMTLQQWLALTNGGVFSVRSTKLKAVDSALGQYERSNGADKRELEKALMAWVQDKGVNWQSSIRNRDSRAVETLFQEVFGVGPKVDQSRLGVLKEEEKALVDQIFRNRKLIWRESYLRYLDAKVKVREQSEKAGVPPTEAHLRKQALPKQASSKKGVVWA